MLRGGHSACFPHPGPEHIAGGSGGTRQIASGSALSSGGCFLVYLLSEAGGRGQVGMHHQIKSLEKLPEEGDAGLTGLQLKPGSLGAQGAAPSPRSAAPPTCGFPSVSLGLLICPQWYLPPECCGTVTFLGARAPRAMGVSFPLQRETKPGWL